MWMRSNESMLTTRRPLQFVKQRSHVPHDGVAHRSIALSVWYVAPIARLSRAPGGGWQRAADREHMRGLVDVRLRDCRRRPARDLDTVFTQAFERGDRQLGLWVGATEGRAVGQAAFA